MRESDAEGGPDPVHGPADEFEAIVAAWRSDGDVPRWPDEPADPDRPEVTRTRPTAPLFDAAPTDPVPADAASIDAARTDVTPAEPVPPAVPFRPSTPVDDEEEHYIPPDPPPISRPGPPLLVGLTLVVIGIVLILSPGWIGVPTPYGLPLGLVAIASGLGWLVLRLWPEHTADDRDDTDDGAIL